ncbi:acetamidase/formamidase family protein [Paractinoplanes rishiriensis]|uniref:Amidase n=1 Tax=Paractinoplanes rishiriensis TaxID=1050105 RepID=A0A919JUH2_9ACTN|nr:acetamidase/formamidase family protein [Actinoplanes rishiriensis]GIE93880.1 amidase [Actinoplanes rishiriensis]
MLWWQVTVAESRFIDATDATVGYTFGRRDPVAVIEPYELVRLRTWDCFAGKVASTDDLPSKVCQFPYLNPVTGPLYVDGARPGDTLAVHVVELTPAADVGFSSTFPHFGALTGTATTAMLHPALEERVWQYTIDHQRGTVRYTARSCAFEVDLPLQPMLGTVGVAPAGGEVRASIVPGVHGGNLDMPQLRAGTTVYLPVGVEGALLAVGDGHARQGDGELCGVAVEVPMHVTLVVDVLSEVSTPVPRLETDAQFMSIGVARPLEDSYRAAHLDLVRQLVQLTGLDELDAYQLVSQAGSAYVGNVVDADYTIAAAIDKALIAPVLPYHGAHKVLRAIRGGD